MNVRFQAVIKTNMDKTLVRMVDIENKWVLEKYYVYLNNDCSNLL